MRHGSRPFTAFGAKGRTRRAVKAASILTAGAIAGAAAPAMASDVVITVTNIRSSEGVVRACITADRKSFPKCNKDPKAKRVVVPAKKSVTIRFTGVAAGSYAIALLHDENNNGKADRRLGMIPKEGYGFSRDAKVVMGPPSYKDAVFKHGSGTQRLTIKMRYW
ncbi:MAG: DUF2141 domain-containing protein [Pseudomonadota bacterium]